MQKKWIVINVDFFVWGEENVVVNNKKVRNSELFILFPNSEAFNSAFRFSKKSHATETIHDWNEKKGRKGIHDANL